MQFVDLANRFESTITIAKGEQVVDGKSPMEIMLLEATYLGEFVTGSVDAVGGISSGGGYELIGAVGQPDAGPGAGGRPRLACPA